MNMTITMLRTVAEVLVQRLRDAREDERGMTTETIIITALLAALAIIVVGLIVTKVTSKASTINVE